MGVEVVEIGRGGGREGAREEEGKEREGGENETHELLRERSFPRLKLREKEEGQLRRGREDEAECQGAFCRRGKREEGRKGRKGEVSFESSGSRRGREGEVERDGKRTRSKGEMRG